MLSNPFILIQELFVYRCEQRRAKELEKGGAPSDENNQDDEYTIDESKLGPPFGIVINGHSLVSILISFVILTNLLSV